MFHTNIRHELCLHGGMVLKKSKMGVGGPSVRGCPNLVVSITSMDGSGHSESKEHPQVECFPQITSVRRASRRTVGRGTKSPLFFASRIFRHCCVRNRVYLDFIFPTRSVGFVPNLACAQNAPYLPRHDRFCHAVFIFACVSSRPFQQYHTQW